MNRMAKMMTAAAVALAAAARGFLVEALTPRRQRSP